MTVLANGGSFFYSMGSNYLFFQFRDSGGTLRLWPQGSAFDAVTIEYNGTSSHTYDMSASIAFEGKRSSFYGEEYDFAISTEYVNYDKTTDEENDLKIGFWFDGVLYGNEYFYINNCVSLLTPQKIMIRGAAAGYTVHSPSINSDFEGFTRVTLKDFGFADDIYQGGTFHNPSKYPIMPFTKNISAPFSNLIELPQLFLTHINFSPTVGRGLLSSGYISNTLALYKSLIYLAVLFLATIT